MAATATVPGDILRTVPALPQVTPWACGILPGAAGAEVRAGMDTATRVTTVAGMAAGIPGVTRIAAGALLIMAGTPGITPMQAGIIPGIILGTTPGTTHIAGAAGMVVRADIMVTAPVAVTTARAQVVPVYGKPITMYMHPKVIRPM